MDKRHLRILTALMILMVLLTALNVAVSFLNKQHPDVLKNAIRKEIESIKIPEAPLPVIPVKGVDYFDGKDGRDGRDGKDSVSTHTVEKETIVVKEAPKPAKDGLSPIIRCNESKNRWEIRYITTAWSAILNESELPVKCKI